VLTKGKLHGSNVTIYLGGQTLPMSIAGAKLQCKKLQKKEKKNIISETMNNNTPKRIPFCTLKV